MAKIAEITKDVKKAIVLIYAPIRSLAQLFDYVLEGIKLQKKYDQILADWLDSLEDNQDS